jgi:Ni/Fe-hydrogenase subunit HybB-like protein
VKLELLFLRDNTTRWNSTYISIYRALKLESYIKIFTKQYLAELKDDELTEED